MIDPALALSAAWQRPAALPDRRADGRPSRRVIVLGGAGALGTAIVERLVGAGRCHPVALVVSRPMASWVRGLEIVADLDAAWSALAPDTAVLVFDRERRSHGREDALRRPRPEELPQLAARLQTAGVRRLLVAVPHGPQGLPAALRHGLAHLDEAAVAAMGFEQIVFFRLSTSSAPRHAAADGDARISRLQRLAELMLSQLQWMVPAVQVPVRPKTVADVVVALLQGWGEAAPATRVLPPELLGQVAQGADAEGLVQAWLGGAPLPAWRAPRRRW